ncbi:hypothetical protein N0V90_012959 [Kalmusia sp. IMI 367209]|nr:hypothetical protein N0V90_012959 [Kalmusia sp. IMI 367209]
MEAGFLHSAGPNRGALHLIPVLKELLEKEAEQRHKFTPVAGGAPLGFTIGVGTLERSDNNPPKRFPAPGVAPPGATGVGAEDCNIDPAFTESTAGGSEATGRDGCAEGRPPSPKAEKRPPSIPPPAPGLAPLGAVDTEAGDCTREPILTEGTKGDGVATASEATGKDGTAEGGPPSPIAEKTPPNTPPPTLLTDGKATPAESET